MATLERTLGPCPDCGATIARTDVLIEYETDGRPAAYAECPACRAVVDPLNANA